MTTRHIASNILRELRRRLGKVLFMQLVDRFLTRENILGFLDGVFDFFEHYASTTETEVDDKLIKQIREALAIPDDDDTEAPSDIDP